MTSGSASASPSPCPAATRAITARTPTARSRKRRTTAGSCHRPPTRGDRGPGTVDRVATVEGADVPLRLGTRTFGDTDLLVMAVVNRTPDSFFDRGATYAEDAALAAVDRAVDEGAEIVDIGGVKAGYGPEVDAAEEARRVVGFVERVRARHADLVISVDTWRADVGRAVCAAGADLLNDAWAGHDPHLLDAAAEAGAGYVCTHTGGLPPRTDPHPPAYDHVVADV